MESTEIKEKIEIIEILEKIEIIKIIESIESIEIRRNDWNNNYDLFAYISDLFLLLNFE